MQSRCRASGYRGRIRGQGSSTHQYQGRGASYRGAHGNTCGAVGGASSHRNCHRCGRAHYKGQKCPAIDKQCNYCHIKGHYEKMCRNKQKHVNSIDVNDHDCAYMYDDNYVDVNT